MFGLDVLFEVALPDGFVGTVGAREEVSLQPQVLVLHVRLEDPFGAGAVFAKFTSEVSGLFVHRLYVRP